jgi:heptosyltransferase-1
MKILITRVGAMGDIIHTLPAVADLHAQRPDWQIDWAIAPHWEPLLVGDTKAIVTRTHIVPTKDWSASPLSIQTLRSILTLRKQIRREHYDLVVDMQGTLRSAVIGRFAHAKNYFGYEDPRESFAKNLYKQTAPRIGTHVVEMNAALLSAATGLTITPRSFALPRTEWAENWAEHEAVFTRPLAVLGPGGGWAAKQWPAARFGELARRLKTMGFDVAINAPRQDDPIANEVVEASNHAARLVVCNVAGLIALLRRTDLFIGGDSGPTHLAASLAIPTVALFGPTDPARNGPWGPGPKRTLRDPAAVTSYKHTDTPDPTLARLPVEDVLDAVWDLAPHPQP